MYLSQIIMKKGRPATKISVLVSEAQKRPVIDRLLNETSTFGVRFYEVNRVTLDREVQEVATVFGPVEVKLGIEAGRVVKAAPEYEACQKIALREKVSLKNVYDAATRSAAKMVGKKVKRSS